MLNRHELHVNLQVANSMKILAIVTVLFLPATFVASLFSINMFDWHLADGETVSHQFWIYWVVTVPLTIVIIVAFGLITSKKSDLPELPRSSAWARASQRLRADEIDVKQAQKTHTRFDEETLE